MALRQHWKDDAPSAAKLLRELGVVVVRHSWFVDNLQALQQQFIGALRSFPEYKRSAAHPDQTPDGKAIEYVQGAFAAFGNPASFHNPLVRRLREHCMYALMPLFSQYAKAHGFERLEQIIDRMMYRTAGKAPTKESWHRDEAPLALDGDITLGGWLNLDSKSQFLSCVPGTQLHGQTGRGGFAKITQAEAQRLGYDQHKQAIEVPPGHLLVMNETIVHEVVPRKLPYNSKRLFLGWRLTNSPEPLLANIDGRLANQEVMPLKSNQIPPMYSQNAWVYSKQRNALQDWSVRTFQPQCLALTTIQSGEHKGEEVSHVHRRMQSLRNYGLPVYPPYSLAERNLYKPQRSFTMRKPGHQRVRVHVEL